MDKITDTRVSEYLRKLDKDLPVYRYRSRIISYVKKNDSVVIMSETGSGKSTQIPRFLLETAHGKKIVCTQPRRVAAISLAKHVAAEMLTNPGDVVGYMVRFDNKCTENSRLIYATDGALLRESTEDNLLMTYSIVIFDEAHERSLHTDILFGVVKRAQELRKKQNLEPLKIVVMSATINTNKFSTYFNAKTLVITGHRYPVRMFYSRQTYSSDHIDLAYSTISKLHSQYPIDHDFLVFLCGQDEIEFLKCVLDREFPDMTVYALFSALPMSLQLSIFCTTSTLRRVILATNIAETSITIPGVKVVIDSGYVKQKTFDPTTHLVSLKIRYISKTEARQRAGRVGRSEPGFCYRLYTEAVYRDLSEDPVPELLRCSLSGTLLTLLSSGVKDPKDFDWIDQPDPTCIESSWSELWDLSAVKHKSKYTLTQYGKMMAKLPVSPRFAKVIILAANHYRCSVEIVIIIALLSEQTVFYIPKHCKDSTLEARKKFTSCYGDVLTLLNVFQAFKAATKSSDKEKMKEWCHDHGLNYKVLSNARKIQSQLYSKMNLLELPIISAVSTFHDSVKESEAILTCLLSGFFDYTVYYDSRERVYKTLLHQETVYIHPSSIFHKSKHKFLFFTEKVHTTNNFIRNISVFCESYINTVIASDNVIDRFKEALKNVEKASVVYT